MVSGIILLTGEPKKRLSNNSKKSKIGTPTINVWFVASSVWFVKLTNHINVMSIIG